METNRFDNLETPKSGSTKNAPQEPEICIPSGHFNPLLKADRPTNSIRPHTSDSDRESYDYSVRDAKETDIVAPVTEVNDGMPLPGESLYRVRLIEKDQPDLVFWEPGKAFEIRNYQEPESHLADVEFWEDIDVKTKEAFLKEKFSQRKALPERETRVDARKRAREGKPPADIDEYWHVLKHKNGIISINNSKCQAALREVCKYYPTQSLLGRIWIHQPFKILWHYYDELQGFENTPQSGKGKEMFRDTKATRDIIEQIFEMMRTKRELWDGLTAERNRHRSDKSATWEYLWLLFRPGDAVYAMVNNYLAQFRVVSTNETRYSNKEGESHEVLRVTVWFLKYHHGRIKRQTRDFDILRFHGEKPIGTLEVYPSKYHPENDAVCANLTKNGKRYWKILREQYKYMKYDGLAGEDTTKKV